MLRSPPSPRRAQSAVQVLQDHLAEAMGSSVLASAALTDALHRAGRTEVPTESVEMITFAWVHLVAGVATMSGLARATAFVEKLQRALEGLAAQSIVPFQPQHGDPPRFGADEARSEVRGIGAGLRAVLVDSDALDRAMLARVLVRASMSLVVAEALEDMLIRQAEMADVHVVEFNFDLPTCATTLRKLCDRTPGFGVVVRAANSHSARSALRDLSIEFYEVLPPRPSTSEAASSVLTLARAVRESLSR